MYLTSGEPFLHIGCEDPLYQVLGLGRNAGPRLRVEVELPLDDLEEDPVLGLRPKRRQARQEDVDDDARAPHVGLEPVALPQHLGRDVVGAPHDLLAHLARPEERRQPEVGRLERGVLGLVEEEEVLGLEVAVDHAHRVAHLDDADDRPRRLRGRRLAIVPLLGDAGEQLAPRAQLHHEVHRERVLVRALDRHDARVACERWEASGTSSSSLAIDGGMEGFRRMATSCCFV